MSELVLVLCTLTSFACCILLLRAYRRTRTRLLFWSGIGFAAFAANNALVFVDLIVVPEVSLLALRSGATLAGLLVLIVGLVSDTGRSGS
ncbi:MAG TPA: DUF5985 family protein [Polyangiaceae bacterium]|nr:DUF5985 family protein [Polyangiaceae bacterium]